MRPHTQIYPEMPFISLGHPLMKTAVCYRFIHAALALTHF